MKKYSIGVDYGTQSGRAIVVELGSGKERGGHDSIVEAASETGKVLDKVYKPIPQNVEIYNKLYNEYELLHDYFGRGANDDMKRLKEIKREQSK